jgi:hypothetical protein
VDVNEILRNSQHYKSVNKPESESFTISDTNNHENCSDHEKDPVFMLGC